LHDDSERLVQVRPGERIGLVLKRVSKRLLGGFGFQRSKGPGSAATNFRGMIAQQSNQTRYSLIASNRSKREDEHLTRSIIFLSLEHFEKRWARTRLPDFRQGVGGGMSHTRAGIFQRTNESWNGALGVTLSQDVAQVLAYLRRRGFC
jgi:hypothetical protein